MPPSEMLIPFLLASAVFACVPGPGMLYADAHALAAGRRTGWMAALGFHAAPLADRRQHLRTRPFRRHGLPGHPVPGPVVEEHLKGSLEVGKLADVAVLDRDYFTVPPQEIREIQVDATILGGTVVWER
ncbi:amidohydrolase family protein [Thalassobaculum sp.]|uniref:amidohydrolase family protein n=1 Tax=Thalassobaculum sp. TaxID=2022740 RepID=UPI0032ED8C01